MTTDATWQQILDRLTKIETMLQPLVEHRADAEVRLRQLEQTAVTREEMDRQHRRTLGWVSVIVSAIGIVMSASASIIIALLTG